IGGATKRATEKSRRGGAREQEQKTVGAEKLTKSLLKAPPPPARGERYIYDAELTGFAVKLFAPTKSTPKGARTFVLVYRHSGSLRRYRIGSWPEWSVTAAHDEARDIRRRIDHGEDPVRQRRERREAPPMARLAGRYDR